MADWVVDILILLMGFGLGCLLTAAALLEAFGKIKRDSERRHWQHFTPEKADRARIVASESDVDRG